MIYSYNQTDIRTLTVERPTHLIIPSTKQCHNCWEQLTTRHGMTSPITNNDGEPQIRRQNTSHEKLTTDKYKYKMNSLRIFQDVRKTTPWPSCMSEYKSGKMIKNLTETGKYTPEDNGQWTASIINNHNITANNAKFQIHYKELLFDEIFTASLRWNLRISTNLQNECSENPKVQKITISEKQVSYHQHTHTCARWRMKWTADHSDEFRATSAPTTEMMYGTTVEWDSYARRTKITVAAITRSIARYDVTMTLNCPVKFTTPDRE